MWPPGDQQAASSAAYAAMAVVIDDTGLPQPAIAFSGLLIDFVHFG